MDLSLLVQVLIRMSPLLLVAAAIGGQVYWLGRREARARFLEKLLEEVVEPALFKALKQLPEDRAFYLGVTPSPATTSYQAFEALGGAKALFPNKAQWWEQALRHLAGKFGLEVGYIGGHPQCKHPIRFAHPRLGARGVRLIEEK